MKIMDDSNGIRPALTVEPPSGGRTGTAADNIAFPAHPMMRCPPVMLAALAIGFTALATGATPAHVVDSPEAFDRLARDRFVSLQTEPPGIQLSGSWLIATEAGITAKHTVRLSDSTHIRKTFDLPLAAPNGADLYLYRGGGSPGAPMRIEVNGRTLEHTASDGEAASGWRRQAVPGTWLKPGRNTFVLSGNGTIHVDTRSPMVGSDVSYDHGRNWHPADGEAILRLRLRGYPPQGQVMSDIIDTGRLLAPDRAIGPWPSAQRARLSWDGHTPRGTAIDVWWRSGTTPRFAPSTWSAWQRGPAASSLSGRYFQWRMDLRTRDPSRTPRVHAVRTTFSDAVPAAMPPWTAKLAIVDHDHAGPADESAYSFTYETDGPRVRYLRDKAQLDSLVQPAQQDLEATRAIRTWVTRRWQQGWNAGHYRYVPPWDALILLDMAPDNLCLGMCTHYTTVYVQSSVALGYLSRHVIIQAHCLAETFLNDRGRWALQDTGPGAGPDGYPVGLHFERNGEPLNALDMHRLRAQGLQESGTQEHQESREMGEILAVFHPETGPPRPYNDPQREIGLYRRFGMALRNNHLSMPEPAEEEHGSADYRYDGYLWWSESLDDPPGDVACFSQLSNRATDFYPAPNTTRIELAAGAENVLDVALWCTTPNLKGYQINIDGTGWKQVPQPTFAWPLSLGRNRLEVRAVNGFGRSGPIATTVVDRY